MTQLQLRPVSSGICQIFDGANLHVGTCKLIGGVWKFKAIGYDESGKVIPGGGPMTGAHNTVFADLSEVQSDRLLQSRSPVQAKSVKRVNP